MKVLFWCSGFLLILLLLTCFACSDHSGPSAQTAFQVPPPTSVAIPPASGAAMYDAYCASCHGRTGRGEGTAAAALKVPPPDLTTLARRNGGRYPGGQVFQIIEWGGAIASHGSREMPVWGVAFRPFSHESQKQVTERIHTLTAYVGDMQEK